MIGVTGLALIHVVASAITKGKQIANSVIFKTELSVTRWKRLPGGVEGVWRAGPSLDRPGRGCPILDVLGQGWARCCRELRVEALLGRDHLDFKNPKEYRFVVPTLAKSARMGQPHVMVVHTTKRKAGPAPTSSMDRGRHSESKPTALRWLR